MAIQPTDQVGFFPNPTFLLNKQWPTIGFITNSSPLISELGGFLTHTAKTHF